MNEQENLGLGTDCTMSKSTTKPSCVERITEGMSSGSDFQFESTCSTNGYNKTH